MLSVGVEISFEKMNQKIAFIDVQTSPDIQKQQLTV